MWDFLFPLFGRFASSAIRLWAFLYEDNRPEARRILYGCTVVATVVLMASVITLYLATMR
jgi:hypothetical protein